MKIHKALFVIPGIIFSVTLTGITSYLRMYSIPWIHLFKSTIAKITAETLLILAVGLAFGVVCWLMWVWDAGDRIPPIILLVVGLFGIVSFFLNIFADFNFRFSHFGLFYDPVVILLSTLFIFFGGAGLFIKPKPIKT
jgi:hypothetical protein